MGIQSYRDMDVWKKSMDVVVAVYQLSAKFPPQERCGLTMQMRQAAIAIPAKIANGTGRSRREDFLEQLSLSSGSVAELETLLLLAVRLSLATDGEIAPILRMAKVVGRILHKIIEAPEPQN